MPLIIITGYPSCGKTTFCNKLKQYLIDNNINESLIEIINEESENIKKSTAYFTSTNEKNTRNVLKSAINHKLNSDRYIIADSLNYIKGYRYELFCSTKSFRTPHCVVWIQNNDDKAIEWNNQRDDKYEDETLIDLRRRFEAPNIKNRWDSPLFIVNTTPDLPVNNNIINIEDYEPSKQITTSFKSSWKPKASTAPSEISVSVSQVSKLDTNSDQLSFSGSYLKQNNQIVDDIDTILPKIYNYISNAVAPIPNASTLPIQHVNADMLYELDRISKIIIDNVIKHQNNNTEGTPIIFPEYNRSFSLFRFVSLNELQRHRQQFIKVNSLHPPSSIREIGELFIDYLNTQI